MDKPYTVAFLILSLCLITIMRLSSQSFIQVKKGQFFLQDRPYFVAGANLWYGHLLRAGTQSEQQRLQSELNDLQSLGINNLRVVIDGCGPETEPFRVIPSIQPQLGIYNEKILLGLDVLLAECKSRQISVVLCLNNFWHWTGGMGQYVAWATGKKIPYPENTSWHEYQRFAAKFYTLDPAIKAYLAFVKMIIYRKNTMNQLVYRNDPTIMAWQLANEPRGYNHKSKYINWIKSVARKIKEWDPYHLVSLGGEGTTSSRIARNAFDKISKIKDLDYLTVHCWIENWRWYDPEDPEQTYPSAIKKVKSYLYKHAVIAQEFEKPLVLEEFGIARDNKNYVPQSLTSYRDQYFQWVFTELQSLKNAGYPISGSNFWAWSGHALPPNPGNPWQEGDPFTGDPPHEPQGWYSVYAQDSTTLQVIRNFGKIK